jgi:hypothetical protein
MSIEKVIYTARAKAMSGRVGTAKSDDGQINLTLDRRVKMGKREWHQSGTTVRRGVCSLFHRSFESCCGKAPHPDTRGCGN